MNTPFDYDSFVKQFATILVNFGNKSFTQLTKEANAVGRKYKRIRHKSARAFIDRHIANWKLTFALHSPQSQLVVTRLYRRVMRLGFNDPHAIVATATGYAAYCTESGRPMKGLQALQEAREVIRLDEGILAGPKRKLLRPIDSMIRRLEKNGRL